jgi:hypothetical protein
MLKREANSLNTARDGVDREAYITEILFPEVGPVMFNAPC